MNLTAFFNRIGYTGSTEPTLDVLTDIQYHFLLAVPFENLDIHHGKEIDFSSRAVFRKIVEEHRGGLCYETNGLFYDALIALGFSATILAAEMCTKEPPKGFYDHMALGVHIDGEDYLVDVGNGRSLGAPVPISGAYTTSAEGFSYKIHPFDQHHYALSRQKQGENDRIWQPRFVFSTTPRWRLDFIEACEYMQSSPDSIFTQKEIASILTDNGRATIFRNRKNDDENYTLTDSVIDQSGEITRYEQSIAARDLNLILGQPFGISLKNDRDKHEPGLFDRIKDTGFY